MNFALGKHHASPSQKEMVSAKRSEYSSNVQQNKSATDPLNVLVSQSLVSFDTSLGRDFFPPLPYDPLCGRLLLVTLRKRWWVTSPTFTFE